MTRMTTILVTITGINVAALAIAVMIVVPMMQGHAEQTQRVSSGSQAPHSPTSSADTSGLAAASELTPVKYVAPSASLDNMKSPATSVMQETPRLFDPRPIDHRLAQQASLRDLPSRRHSTSDSPWIPLESKGAASRQAGSQTRGNRPSASPPGPLPVTPSEAAPIGDVELALEVTPKAPGKGRAQSSPQTPPQAFSQALSKALSKAPRNAPLNTASQASRASSVASSSLSGLGSPTASASKPGPTSATTAATFSTPPAAATLTTAPAEAPESEGSEGSEGSAAYTAASVSSDATRPADYRNLQDQLKDMARALDRLNAKLLDSANRSASQLSQAEPKAQTNAPLSPPLNH